MHLLQSTQMKIITYQHCWIANLRWPSIQPVRTSVARSSSRYLDTEIVGGLVSSL